MEHQGDLASIVERVAWARSPEDLFRFIPELRSELPPLALVEDRSTILLPTPEPFLTGVLEFLCDGIEKSQTHDTLVDSSESTVLEDPLVKALLDLWMTCGRPGSRCQAVPTLALVWAASHLMSSHAPWLNRLPGPLVYRWTTLQPALQGDRRNVLICGLTARIGARLGAAMVLARGAGIRLPASGIVRRTMGNPLVFAFPEGTLSPREDLTEIGALLQAPLNGDMLNHLIQIADLAWRGIAQRVSSRKPTAVDGLLSQLVPQGSGITALMDPVAGPALIRSLPDLIDTRGLREAGMDARSAKAMLSDVALRPLAAAWTDLVTPLRVWETISVLSGMVAPIWSGQDGVQVRGHDYKPAARWSLRLPRTSASDHAIVAVRLADLIDAGLVHEPGARIIVEACWEHLLSQAQGAVGMLAGDMGVAAFADAERAVEFAYALHGALPGAQGILAHPDGSREFAVSPDLRVGVGIAWGRVDGGTDGSGTWLEGPAVGAAMALTGRASPTLRSNDPLSIRAAIGHSDGLRNDGIVADETFVEALQRSLRHPIHAHGSAQEIAGVADDFRFYPVPYWWEVDSRVWLWMELGGRLQGGPAELSVLNRVMFRDIHSRDKALERSDIAEPLSPRLEPDVAGEPAKASAATEAPEWNPFEAMGRGQAAESGITDPWAQLDQGPEVEIDDD